MEKKKHDLDRKAVTSSKHWPGRYKLRVRTPRKWYFSVQWGVKKATQNEEGKKGGHGDEKARKAVKNNARNEAEKRGKIGRQKTG